MAGPTRAEIDAALADGCRGLEAGVLPVADILAHKVLDILPADPAALALRADLCRRMGLGPEGLPTPPDPAGRYLLIKPWGQGFWAEVSHVLGCLLLAEATGRTPVTLWGRGCIFAAGEGDAFTTYFRPLSNQTWQDAARLAVPGQAYPPKWTVENITHAQVNKWNGPWSRQGPAYFYGRREPLIVCDFNVSVAHVLPWLPARHRLKGASVEAAIHDLMTRFLVPAADIAVEAEAFFQANLAGRGPVLAVHMRGTDKENELAGLGEFNAGCLPYIDADRSPAIFLLTDDQRWENAIRQRYGARVVAADVQRTTHKAGLHRSGVYDTVRLGREVLIDVLVALRCDRFIGNAGSNISAAIAMWKAWPPGAARTLGPPVHLERDIFLYTLVWNA